MGTQAHDKQRRRAPALTPLIWVGGKTRKLALLRKHLPVPPGGIVVEPFAGSGVFTLAALRDDAPQGFALLDAPTGVSRFWRALLGAADVGAAVDALRAEHPVLIDGASYTRLRGALNTHTQDDARYAALFVAVNWSTFNGLWRTNAAGRNNAPWGGWTLAKDWPVLREQLLQTQALLARASGTVRAWDAREGDEGVREVFARVARTGAPCTVLVDPPYPDTYTGYAGKWSEADFHVLRDAIIGWKRDWPTLRIGITFPERRRDLLPPGWSCIPFDMPDLVSCAGASRGTRTEVLCLSPD